MRNQHGIGAISQLGFAAETSIHGFRKGLAPAAALRGEGTTVPLRTPKGSR